MLAIDADGVLANFDALAEQIFGMNTREYEDKHGTSNFWNLLHAHGSFYRDLPLMPDAMELWNAVKHLNPIILTGCPEHPVPNWSQPQKMAWAAEHFPEAKMITTVSRLKRDHMEKPGDILVDDYLKYRHLWEEAGGIFVHHTSAQDSIEQLRALGVDVR